MAPLARYDAVAEWYEAYIEGEASAFSETTRGALRRLLGPGSGLCLDLGCGTGFYAEGLRALGWTPVGMDVSWQQLLRARRRLACAQADVERLPVGSASVEAAASILIHTDVDDYAAACHEAARVLRPGGRFVHIGVHPCFTGWFADRSNPSGILISPGYWNHDRHFEAWSPRGVRARVGATHLPLSDLLNGLVSAGLTVTDVYEAGEPTPALLGIAAVRTS
ncbi:MAG TPA: methyltransferase domain-containing protein [Chloroflexota bacterium]|nr:methyltransferase domain-containing protein [Chloroflexota bacterium]